MQNKDNRITVAGDNNIIIQDAEHGLRSVPKYLTVPPAEPPTTFVGREEALEQLHQSLQSQQRLLLASGIRGIGKTTLAQAYFHKHQSDYQCMAWVNCPNGILQGLLECTIDDSLGFEAQRDNWERHYQLVWKKLANQQGKHLLVLDNANDGNEVLRYLQPIPNWTILVTTTADLQGRLPQEKVERLREGPAIQLFCAYYEAAKGQDELLRRLLRAIGYHTLTIELLAKNLAELRNYSLQEFCDDLEKRGVLQLPKTRTIDAERYHNMTEVNPKEVIRELFDIDKSNLPGNYSNLLLELAMLPAEPLPYEHLRVLLNITEEIEAEFDQTLKKLSATGWLEHDRAADTYYLHTLIAEVVRDKHHLTYARFAQLADTLDNLLDDEHIKLGEMIPYLPYAQSLAQHLPDAELAGLCLSACDRYSELGNLQLGIWFAEEALKRNELLGNKSKIAIAHQRIGRICQHKGEIMEALKRFQKYSEIYEELITENPNTEWIKNDLAISYDNIGEIYQSLDNFTRALEFLEKSNQLHEELYQANSQNENLKNGLAISYSKLGTFWQRKGDFNRALDFLEKGTDLFKELYRDNPHAEQLKNELAASYSWLCYYWRKQGDWDKALEYSQKDMELLEELYQSNPHNISNKDRLSYAYYARAIIYTAQGQKEEARSLYQKAETYWQELHELTQFPKYEDILDDVRARIAELRTGKL